MTTDARLTRCRRACIARALEASECPEEIADREALVEVQRELRAALRAARRIDPGGRHNRRLQAALEDRLRRLADRFDALLRQERAAVVAQLLALAALGHAAGYAVSPLARDFPRTPGAPDGGLDTLAG